jgi:wobble nucleotide-excising tRNase
VKIKSIAEIDNFGIFKNFDWDSNLKYQNKQGQDEIYDFKDINILYGRNYSGKTSLSKIIRALEIKSISSKYENPNFKIELSDGSIISPNNLSTFAHPIHVYNSDFVKENLKFIHDENANIESFSVTLGGDNQEILNRIQLLKKELGSNIENNETELHLAIKNKTLDVKNATQVHKQTNDILDNLLKNKASGSSDSIRSLPNLYGDQEYNVGKLKRTDIPLVLNSAYQPLNDEKELELRNILDQRELNNPPELSAYTLNFPSLINSTATILKTVVGNSQKIQELINTPSLNSWVQTGHSLHLDRSTCAFCNNEISDTRRKELAQHFDQEFQLLQNRISKGIQHLEQFLVGNELRIDVDINQYYQKYHIDLFELNNELEAALKKQKSSITHLKTLLEQKNGNPFTELEAEYPQDHSAEIKITLEKISQIRNLCIQFNSQLRTQQNEAKRALRLNHIYHFLQDINYSQRNTDIDLTFAAIAPLEMELETLQTRKTTIAAEIKRAEDKLKSEGEACKRINDILNHDFGHQALSLNAIENPLAQNIHFEIHRNGAKAHNLSEGEESLIAFCYFLAKIQDDLEQNKNPILWIDDPICSLDNNHIYFIYSLIENICLENKFSQIFVSTHNLDFLKYLNQLTPMGKTEYRFKRERAFYQVEKTFFGSMLKKMAYHLEQNSSEFIYLFDIIYQCSLANEVNDSNHLYFYNFANNARKFLEIYTYYLFPNPALKDRQRLQKFWGDRLPRIFSERINHDGSHAVTILEGKITLRDFSEINTNAKLILNKLNECNPEQYKSLLESIGNISVT